jgi:hypothetical protein
VILRSKSYEVLQSMLAAVGSCPGDGPSKLRVSIQPIEEKLPFSAALIWLVTLVVIVGHARPR